MACLNESDLQGHSGRIRTHPLLFRWWRATWSRAPNAALRSIDVLATHQRVNVWLSELSSPAQRCSCRYHRRSGSGPELRIAGTPHAATVTADDHLARLLAPDTEITWYKSIVGNIREMIRPEKLPPLELTSTPVAVKDIWGQGTSRRALASSVLFQGALVAALMLLGTNEQVQKAFKAVVLVAPPPVVKQVEVKQPPAGGGQRSALPALKAALPKPAPRVFTPPLVTIEHPALTMDASLIAPPDAWAAPTGAIGNPLGSIGGGWWLRQWRRHW